MMDVHRRYESALKDTVDEWKNHESVLGIFAYGSFVKGTATADSDLDICIVWNGEEAPVRLLSTHKEVRIDVLFITAKDVEAVLERKVSDVLAIAGVVGRLRGAKVVHDSKGKLKKWQERASDYVWSDGAILTVKEKALGLLNAALQYVEQDEAPSAILEAREALLQLGRAIVMTNNIFHILKPAEVLSEVRLLDPMTYQLFLRAYKLKGMNETKLLTVLTQLKEWLDKAEARLENPLEGVDVVTVTTYLAEAQRQYYGALGLTYAGDLELAVLEMRLATTSLGRALVALQGGASLDDATFLPPLMYTETEFYNEIFVENGGYDIQLSEAKRIVGESKFMAQRV